MAWTIKDPVTMHYFTFSAEEFSILQSLDGKQQLEDLRSEFERHFPPQRLTMSRLVQFISELHSQGLLLADDEGQGNTLLEKRAKNVFQERLNTWSSPLAIRFRGVDPELGLGWLYNKCRWCFSPTYAAFFLVIVVAAILMLITHFQDFRDELPTISEFVSVKNLLWLSLSLAFVKILHEVGHGLACKHFGGECHEMGFMLLMFVPCLYCNVSDAWMLKERYQRIAISLAGILVEMLLAAVAIFVWWYSQPGFWHAMAFNTVLVCGFNTIIVNGNPLLRYDGYFVLSDSIGIQNLWQESRLALRRQMYNFFIKEKQECPVVAGDSLWILLIYAVSSKIYRSFILVGIALALYSKFVAARLEIVAWLFSLSVACAFLLAWGPAIIRRLSDPSFSRMIRWAQVTGTAAIFVAGLLVFTLIRLPCEIVAPILFQLDGAHHVYVSTSGIVKSFVAQGTEVNANEQVAQLENSEVERKIIELTGERGKLQTRITHLEARVSINAALAADLAIAREMCNDVEHQLEQKMREQKALILTSPIAGTVIAPPISTASLSDDVKLATWSGTPLDAQNRLCHLQRGTLFCIVGNPTKFEAIAFVDETAIEFIHLDQQALLRVDIGNGGVILGRVKEIAEKDIQFIPDELAWGRDLATRREGSGKVRPLEASYQVRLQFDSPAKCPLIIGARGTAKIQVEPQTLADRFFRQLRRIFKVRTWNSDTDTS